MWEHQEKPFVVDVIISYNEGSPAAREPPSRRTSWLLNDATGSQQGNRLAAVRKWDWKLHIEDQGRPSERFNLTTDIGEKANLLNANPEGAERLMAILITFAKDIADNNRPVAFIRNPKPLSK